MPEDANRGVFTHLEQKLISSCRKPIMIETIDRASFEYLLKIKDREVNEEFHPIINAERTRREKFMRDREQARQ